MEDSQGEPCGADKESGQRSTHAGGKEGLVVSLSSGLLQPVSNASLVAPGSAGSSSSMTNGLQQLSALADPSESTASGASTTSAESAQLADDTYTSSSQSTQTVSNAMAGISVYLPLEYQAVESIPTSLAVEMGKAMFSGDWNPAATADTALYKAIESGNLSASQTAYTQWMQALQNPVYQMSSYTAPSQQFLNGMAALGVALASGDMASIKSIYESSVHYLAPDLGSAITDAYAPLEEDGENTSDGLIAAYDSGSVSAFESGSSYQADTNQIATDFRNYDAVLQENATLLSNYLVSQGFSAEDSAKFASNCFQIELPTENQNSVSSMNSDRAAQYVQALNQFAESYVASKSTYTPGDGPMCDMIDRVLEDTWLSEVKQTQSLIQATMSPGSTAQSSAGQTVHSM